MPEQPFDPYAELQLSPDAEPELVKAAFKALAKKYHPDRFSNPAEKAEAERKMARINEAQRLLASGNYTPPRPKSTPFTSESPQAEPPPPSTPPPHRPIDSRSAKPSKPISLGAYLLVGLIFLALVLVPGLLSENHLQKALALEEQGRIQDALIHMNEAIKDSPHDRNLYTERARLWEKLGEPEKAETDRRNAEPPSLRFPTPESTPNQVSATPDQKSQTHVP